MTVQVEATPALITRYALAGPGAVSTEALVLE